MESFKKIVSGLDVSEIRKELKAADFLWNEITARQTTPGTAHADTETIFLRWSVDTSIEAVFTDLVAVDYPACRVLANARAMVSAIHSLVGGELGRAIIVKLKPDGVITPHVDEGAYADYYDRFHLPIYTNSGNNLYVSHDEQSGEYCSMGVGELWWFDHKKSHYGCNTSSVNRIHLIVDIHTDRFRKRVGDEISKRIS